MTILPLSYILKLHIKGDGHVFYVKEISTSIYPLIQKGKKGVVHSVYKNVINISVEGHIVSIQADILPKTPFSLTVYSCPILFQELEIHKGDEVDFQKSQFSIGSYIFNVDSTNIWDAQLTRRFCVNRESSKREIETLSKNLAIYGKNDGLGKLPWFFLETSPDDEFKQNMNHVVSIALPLVQNLLRNAGEGRIDVSAVKGASLIGLGPGLTPSGDDFLIGLLSVLLSTKDNKAVVQQFAECLKSEVIKNVNKTTFLSRELLLCGCRGDFSEPFHYFYDSLITNDAKQILSSSIDFINTGHTSGTDALSGILFGLILINTLQ